MVIDLPAPSNISYLWNFGSLLGVCLVVQLLSGIFLAMHYTPHVDLAFNSVEHIMRDVNFGWFLRYLHANGASMFFIMVYLHIGRGLYHGSYTKPREMLWGVGVVILIVMMATAFIGYVLPWGQMSFWGATVITNLISAIPYVGQDIVEWIWGGFSISNATLNRFFSLHYLLPFVLTGLVIVHLIALHEHGSNNPLGVDSNIDKLPFHPYFTLKDGLGFLLFAIFFSYFVYFNPNLLGQGWPSLFIMSQCAVCWKYMLIYNNTNYISGFNYPVLVKTYYKVYNQQVTKVITRLLSVGTSETTRTQKILKKNTKFNEWLAGLIDGDGYFCLAQKKYPNCEITVGIDDEKMLRIIQNKYGGSIRLRSGAKAFRYRLQHREGIKQLLLDVNGNIRNSKRLPQFYKVCATLEIEVIQPIPLTIDNAWISGFFDAEGTINYYLNNERPQLFLSITNKYLKDVEEIKNILGGKIYFDKAQNGYFKWVLTNEKEHNTYYEYNKLNPSKSKKGKRIFKIKEYYRLYHLKAYKSTSSLYSRWKYFNIIWRDSPQNASG